MLVKSLFSPTGLIATGKRIAGKPATCRMLFDLLGNFVAAVNSASATGGHRHHNHQQLQSDLLWKVGPFPASYSPSTPLVPDHCGHAERARGGRLLQSLHSRGGRPGATHTLLLPTSLKSY